MEEAPDEALMLAHQDGDAGAFDTLYRRHKGPLYRFMLRTVRNERLVEEPYPDVWMRAIESLALRAGGALSTWLYIIAHNRMMDHF